MSVENPVDAKPADQKTIEDELANLSSEELDKLVNPDADSNSPPEPTQATDGDNQDAKGVQKPQGQTDAAPPQEDVLNTIRSDMEKLQKRVDDKDGMISRQADEIGQLRKLAQLDGVDSLQPNNGYPQQYPQQYPQNPYPQQQPQHDAYGAEENPITPLQAVKIELDKREKDRDRQNYQAQQASNHVKDYVNTQIPDFGNHIDDIAEIAQEIGISPENVSAFRSNPYVNDAATLLGLAKAAHYKKQFTDMQDRIKSIRNKDGGMVDKIKKARDQSTAITGASGQSTKVGNIVVKDSQVGAMSDEELTEILANDNG